MKSPKLRLFSNSSLADYKDCPRLFYYKYILEWKPQMRALPLIFGGAWHRAQDRIWAGFAVGLDNERIIREAYTAFCQEWVAGGLPAPEEFNLRVVEDYGARNPMQAHEMIVGYVHKRRGLWDAGDIELIDIERPFAVPLDPEDEKLFYVGKIDKVLKRRRKVLGIEHKTTAAYRKEGGFKGTYLDGYHLNSQVDGYLYALHMEYPNDEVDGVWVDAALVHRSQEEFKFIPIEKQMVALDQWLGETRSWVASIEADIAAAQDYPSQLPYMTPFRRRTENCIRYEGKCPFFDICMTTPNPIGLEIPRGFSKEPWDPLEHLNRDRLQFGKEKNDPVRA